jgi:hypothetical protein
MGTMATRRRNRLKKRYVMNNADLRGNLAQKAAQLKFFFVTNGCRPENRIKVGPTGLRTRLASPPQF